MADVKEEALQCGCGKGETENHGSTPWIDTRELKSWPFWRAGMAEFVATFVFLYVSILTVMGVKRAADSGAGTCGGGIGVGTEGIAWAFGGTIFVLVYCTADVSGGHVNPAVSLGLLLARRVTLPRTLYYVFMQIFGAATGAGVVKAVVRRGPYEAYGGGANDVAYGFSKGAALAAEIVGTFVLVYTVLAATDPRRPKKAAVLAPLAIGFAVFVVHLATIPVTGTGINPARSLGAALVYDRPRAWHHHWIFWVGPAIGAAIAALYQHLLSSAKTVWSA